VVELIIFVTKNPNFQVTYLEINLCSNGLHEAKSRVRYLVSPCDQSGILMGLFLSTSSSPLNYLSTKLPIQIPAATINVVNSERARARTHTHTHTHTQFY